MERGGHRKSNCTVCTPTLKSRVGRAGPTRPVRPDSYGSSGPHCFCMSDATLRSCCAATATVAIATAAGRVGAQLQQRRVFSANASWRHRAARPWPRTSTAPTRHAKRYSDGAEQQQDRRLALLSMGAAPSSRNCVDMSFAMDGLKVRRAAHPRRKQLLWLALAQRQRRQWVDLGQPAC